MKHFCLSPLTRQLIIFLLLIALLWERKPTVGPDGYMLVEFSQFLSYRGFGGFMSEGDYIQIEEQRYDEQTHVITWKLILNAIPLAKATLKEPNKLYLFINHYVPLWRIVPACLRLDGGWIFVLKLTPEQYEVLQAALQLGSKLDFVKMRKDEGEHYLKYRTLP